MYSTLAKTPSFPLPLRFSSQPKCFKLLPSSKSQSLPFGSVETAEFSLFSNRGILGCSNVGNPGAVISGGSCLKSGTRHSLWVKRRFSRFSAPRFNGKRLPMFAALALQDAQGEGKMIWKPRRSSLGNSSKKIDKVVVKSSWEKAAETLEKVDAKSSTEESANTLDSGRRGSSWNKQDTRLNREIDKSSRDEFVKRRGPSSGVVGESRNRERDYASKDEGVSKLPWLASKEGNNKVLEKEKEFSKPGRSSWEKYANNSPKKVDVKPSWEDPAKFNSSWMGSERDLDRVDVGESYQKESGKRFNRESGVFSRDEFAKENEGSTFGMGKGRNRNVDMVVDGRRNHVHEDKEFEADKEEEESEVVGEPRWDRTESGYRGEAEDGRNRFERPEIGKWFHNDKWGKRTWREATTESTVPKMVGEGVYGVGPILAALSARRRDFYALYVQEGLDLSKNNKKKKDKTGIEKIMKMASILAIRIKDVSKHDLNMVVDSRPHQGLVLDASPLEMVNIKKLDRISAKEDKSPLWVALDEVTDPQNLGAIIRSAYFFGASGVVLCAKNSAPLSGVVSKASAGSLELMELRSCNNMMKFLVSSAGNGWRILGGSVSPEAVPVNEVSPGAPTVLVLGSEGTGLRPLVQSSCTQLVHIPLNVPVEMVPDKEDDAIRTSDKSSGKLAADFQSFLAVESLNVSVAAGVLLHHLIGDNYYKSNAGEINQPTNAAE